MLVTSIGSPNSIVKPPNGLYFPVIANGIIFALVFLDNNVVPFLNGNSN